MMPPPPRSAPVLHGLRNTLAVLFAVVAGLAFAGWLGLSWTHDQLLSTEGFERTTRPVAEDAEFQSRVVHQVLRRLSDQPLEDLRTGFGPVDDWVQERRSDLIDRADGWLTAPEQQRLWTQVLVRTHDANVPDGVTADPAPRDLVVDASPMGEGVSERIQDAIHLDLHLDASALRITVPGTRTGPLLDAAVQWAEWRFPLPWIGGLALVFGLLLGTRPWAVLGVAGFSALLLGLVQLAVVLLGSQGLVAASSADPIAELVVTRLVEVLRTDYVATVTPWLVAAAVVCVTGVIGAVVSRRRLTYHGGHVHHS